MRRCLKLFAAVVAVTMAGTVEAIPAPDVFLQVNYDPGVVGARPLTLDVDFDELNGATLPSTLGLDFVFTDDKQVKVLDPGSATFGVGLNFQLEGFGGGVLRPLEAFFADIDGTPVLFASSTFAFASGFNQGYSAFFDIFAGLEYHSLHLILDLSDVNPENVVRSSLSYGGGDWVLEVTQFESPPVVTDPRSVPEPGSWLLFSTALLGLILRRRAKESRA